MQTFASLNMAERRWELFMGWAENYLSGDPLSLFLQVPLLLAHAVRRFGDLEFKSGGSLLYYRHLVLAAQRKVPSVKPYISICWDLASRWERVEPTRHRPPVPEVVVEAMVSVGWLLGWRRWCGVVILCFYGIARAGEVLRCSRSDLLLPADMLHESGSAFLVLRSSKTMYRQAARVQHLKITNSTAVDYLNKVFSFALPDQPLYVGGAQHFRRRWEHVLKSLAVSPATHLTPGGLRGGGAVTHYREGGSISDLMWKMRLRNVSTLEAYLQELGAISILTQLSDTSRRRLLAAASFFRLLCFASVN